MSTTTLVTAEEFARMTFDGPVELVRGEIVGMTRPGGMHGVVCMSVAYLTESWIRLKNRDRQWLCVINDTGVVTGRDPDTVRGPDVFIIDRRLLPGGKIPEGDFPVAPVVCVEVKSPHDRWSEIIRKIGEYFSVGVQEVWVIDPAPRRVHVYRADTEPDVLNLGDVLSSAALPDFGCPVDEFFRPLDESD